jgi:hypothetical protein
VRGPSLGGSTITVTGTNYINYAHYLRCKFGTTEVGATFLSATRVRVRACVRACVRALACSRGCAAAVCDADALDGHGQP